nr:hypothetical protein [Tanacetum cinerariifolium]
MNQQETQQVIARDKKWVPSGFYYLCRCPRNLYAQQFWYTIKKVQGIASYEFLLANKECRVDVEVFRKILDICPRVKGEEFTKLQNDDDIFTFLIDLGYKGPLHKYTNTYVDHMSQPWRTLAAIINKCLSGKTASNDRLRNSRIDIMWGMFYRENVDYPELIWEDFAYQIDHRRERKSRCENMPYPRFTKVIINNFLKQHKSLSNLKYQHYHTIKDDGIETVDVSEESELEPVKKKTASRRVVKKKVMIFAYDNIIPDPDISLKLGKSVSLAEAEEEEAAKQVRATNARIVTESVPGSVKKKTGSRSSRSVVIQDIPSVQKPKLVTSKPKLKGSSEGTGTVPGSPDESIVVSATSDKGTGTKLGVLDEEKVITEDKFILKWGSEHESEYLEEDQLDDKEKDDKDGDADDKGGDHIVDTQDTDDEDDETESDEDEIYKYKIWVRKDEDVEMTNAEDDSKKAEFPPTSSNLSVSSGFGDQFLKLSYDTSLIGTIKDITDAEISLLLDIKIQYEVPHDDSKKAEFPPTSSNLSVSSGFGDQFLKLSYDTSLIGTIKDITDVEISLLLDIKIQSDVPHVKSSFMLKVLVFVTSEPYVLTPVQETSSTAPVTNLPLPSVSTTPHVRQQTTTSIPTPPITTDAPIITSIIPESDALSVVQLIVAKLKKDVSELKKVDHSAKALASFKSQHHDDDDDDDDDDPPAGPNQGKKTKRRRTKESESSKKPFSTKETPKGKAPSKCSKTGKFASAKEPVEEPLTEVVMDDANKDVVHKLYWNNPEGGRYPFDLSKPLPLQGHPGHLTVVADYFFNNDLEYLKSSYLERTYTTLITKIKADWYEIVGIEDMVPTLWSPTKVRYDKDALKGIKHWGERCLIIKKCVDLQLGVESYQKKLNITLPQQTFLEIEFKELSIPSHKPPGVIYEDLAKHKRVMRADELYKFSDETLKKVQDEIHHRGLDFFLGYNDEMSRRKWTAIDRKRSQLMAELINKQMRERRIIRNLKRLVGARELKMDYKLMTCTV